jgi:hypothetical protein
VGGGSVSYLFKDEMRLSSEGICLLDDMLLVLGWVGVVDVG